VGENGFVGRQSTEDAIDFVADKTGQSAAILQSRALKDGIAGVGDNHIAVDV